MSELPKRVAVVSGVFHAPPSPTSRPLPVRREKGSAHRRKTSKREARANVLRSHGVEVDAADSLQRARVLWKAHRYDLVLLDVRQQFPGEAPQFYEQIRDASPGQRFAFLVGPPLYVSRRWPLELAFEDSSRGQWGETVTRFLAAA